MLYAGRSWMPVSLKALGCMSQTQGQNQQNIQYLTVLHLWGVFCPIYARSGKNGSQVMIQGAGLPEVERGKHLLECGEFCKGWLSSLEIAFPSRSNFGRRLGAGVRVPAVFISHGLDVTAAPHSAAGNFIIFTSRGVPCPFILRDLCRYKTDSSCFIQVYLLLFFPDCEYG